MKKKQETAEPQKKNGEPLVPIFKKDSSDDNEILLGGIKKGQTPPKDDQLLEEEKKEEEEINETKKDWFKILDKEESKATPIEICDLRPLYPVKKDRSDKKSVISSVSIVKLKYFSYIAASISETWSF